MTTSKHPRLCVCVCMCVCERAYYLAMHVCILLCTLACLNIYAGTKQDQSTTLDVLLSCSPSYF